MNPVRNFDSSDHKQGISNGVKALLLAAGYATRLYPLTLNTAKPLLPVGKKLMIDHTVDKILKIKEIDKIYVVTNQKFFEQFKEWAKVKKCALPIQVVNDKTLSNDDRLGAIGDIGLTISEGKIDDSLLVIAGDNLFDFALEKFLKFAKGKSPVSSIAVYDIKKKEIAGLYGVLEIDTNAKVISFEEKPKNPKSTLISTCIYYFPKAKLNLVKKYLDTSEKKDAPGNYIKWLSENDGVCAFAFDEAWYDIGSKESYEEVKKIYGGRNDK
ncbi:MAG: hypothetical protein COS99_08850 [Candidatus Omnitrophica bacterium CG07_land_8_20_14_0_80_42_15]|uniref:Nucleotidyl transferase domain-containing protein n=1 Tax=Candidatus Aquitaenariimonas noxiae TaxID=1974741 RepID=A0A2J0KQ53_9BACT|nr:MAG: hypothetical protein COS99_08850 [Candidatus Omnitrophica bacterium CG07_land_8_20_14_0_80_42_15]